MAAVEPLVIDRSTSSDGDNLDHIVCCKDLNSRTFCGILDTTNLTEREPKRPCVVCAEMEKTDACPAGGRCTEEPI